jgi:hypothetical protein
MFRFFYHLENQFAKMLPDGLYIGQAEPYVSFCLVVDRIRCARVCWDVAAVRNHAPATAAPRAAIAAGAQWLAKCLATRASGKLRERTAVPKRSVSDRAAVGCGQGGESEFGLAKIWSRRKVFNFGGVAARTRM